jgi:hypothetical protein
MRGVDGLINTPCLTTFRAWRGQIVFAHVILVWTMSDFTFLQILGCIYRQVPLPPTIVSLSGRLAATLCTPIETSSNQLTILMARLAELRYQIATGFLGNDKLILRELSCIQTELLIWLKYVSPTCAYETFVRSDTFDLGLDSKLRPHRGFCHRYPDLPSALMWNNYRITQILVCDMIISQLRPLATMEGNSSHIKAAQIKCSGMRLQMRKLADEICYSAPDILGVLDQFASKPESSTVKSSAGGFVLLFPLSFAVVVDDYPSSLSEWVFECLHIIGRVMGIHQALVLQRFLPTLCGQYSWADRFDPFQA